MQHRLMTNGNTRTNRQRIARVGMKHRSILNITTLTDDNWIVISANNHIEPDAASIMQLYIAYYRGILSYEMFIAQQLNLLTFQ
jgi:hypothetical protein